AGLAGVVHYASTDAAPAIFKVDSTGCRTHSTGDAGQEGDCISEGRRILARTDAGSGGADAAMRNDGGEWSVGEAGCLDVFYFHCVREANLISPNTEADAYILSGKLCTQIDVYGCEAGITGQQPGVGPSSGKRII